MTDPVLSKEELSVVENPIKPYNQASNEAAKIKYLRVAMICGADLGRCGNLVEELQN